jgi:transglutaminase-like putative cysteine protease
MKRITRGRNIAENLATHHSTAAAALQRASIPSQTKKPAQASYKPGARIRTIKRTALVMLVVTALLAGMLWPGLPWSARLRHVLRRATVKLEAQFAALRGVETGPVSISGKLTGSGAYLDAVKGAQVVAIETTSGYGVLSDREGNFILPHLTWYPGATYTLDIIPDIYTARRIEVRAPSHYPEGGRIDVGEVSFDQAGELDTGELAVRFMEYDGNNNEYYRDLFDQLTAGLETDERRVEAINKYVGTRLDYDVHTPSFNNPREIIESGSRFCSNLALAMAAITAAGNYPTRTVHLSDSPEHRFTHVVVEVYYKDGWHLYDPSFGAAFLNDRGEVASYREIRLNPSLVKAEAYGHLDRIAVLKIMLRMPEAYMTGFHQIYYVDK